MKSRSIFSGFVFALILAVTASVAVVVAVAVAVAGASYAGDKPLATVSHGEVCGGVFFTLGDSKYSGRMNFNDSYTVNFETSTLGSEGGKEGGKKVKLARLYVYWVWSQNENVGVYPKMQVLASAGKRGKALNLDLDATYTDTKGFVGKYDYFSGVNVYNCDLNLNTTSLNVVVKNEDANGSTFCVQGVGLLVVYECQGGEGEKEVCGGPNCQRIEYWVNEGCDMIFAEYGITPEMATTKIYFDGELDLKEVKQAFLTTVVPSGGYISGGATSHNRLYFNDEEGWLSSLPLLKQLLRLLLGYGGGAWSDVYHSDNTVQIGLDQREVTDYLKVSNNFAAVQDNRDYMMVTNAVLVVEKVV